MAHGQFEVHQNQQILLWRAVFHLVSPQHVLVHGVVPPLSKISHFLLLNFMRFLPAHSSKCGGVSVTERRRQRKHRLLIKMNNLICFSIYHHGKSLQLAQVNSRSGSLFFNLSFFFFFFLEGQVLSNPQNGMVLFACGFSWCCSVGSNLFLLKSVLRRTGATQLKTWWLYIVPYVTAEWKKKANSI